ncbi:MAG: 16S rRNA (cytosine(967)-C(5))-methyltransferase RsmB [Hylemonella sp.]|uniref:16S rRNA (cytosine(967)-C(5))-methyltransferase RsmB n=1 Tax=Hylemonella sp. TaxID=2066020 RepID=UPI003919CBA7
MSEDKLAPALWRQLQAAAVALAAIRAGTSGTAAIESVPSLLRPGVQALVYAALRQLGRAEALRKRLAPRKPPPAADALLCLALALAWRDEGAPYEVHTLVNQAVEAAKRTEATHAQASFINACLRRFLREREALVAQTDTDPVARWNHPAWWIARLQREVPQHWQAILQANNAQAPMTLRVNLRQGSVEDYLAELAAAGITARRNGPQALTLASALPVSAIPGFARGRVSVQDAAAQLAAPLLVQGLTHRRGLRVFDACAAPGGKTAHLLELLDGAEVTALDIDPARCRRITENLQRQGLQARVLAADAGTPQTWWDGQPFDAILLDAPCTASGIVRRHPDVRWLRRETDIAALAAQQARLLQTLWPLLAPGGRLVYCTCSVFRAEGEEQVQAFLAHNKAARLLTAPGHLWPLATPQGEPVTDNRSSDHDGFYYALLEKGAG